MKDKSYYLNPKNVVSHFDITKNHDIKSFIEAFGQMSFVAREIHNGAKIYNLMLEDKDCTKILVIAGSASAAGCMKIAVDLIKANMIDVIVCTGANIVDMVFLEALGFHHYRGSQFTNDDELRRMGIDRIYDTYISEEELKVCDMTINKIASQLARKTTSVNLSSREFISEMGGYLIKNNIGADSLVRVAMEKGVPIFVPAFSDCSAGFGLSYHQYFNPENHIVIDPVKDFLELTKCGILAAAQGGNTGLFIIGGGSPKNFAQDLIVNAETLGFPIAMHKYAVQITVADSRDGACSSSTFKEACSWGKVDGNYEQMIFSEATVAWPLIAAYAYQCGDYQDLKPKRLADWLNAGGELRNLKLESLR